MAQAPKMDEAPPPLYPDLGQLHFQISTTNPRAQAYFDQGLRLTFSFNHAEAIRAFRAAQRLDPQCAMCYWGEALALGPNINLPMLKTPWRRPISPSSRRVPTPPAPVRWSRR
jgi:hypothetical protein